MPKQITEKIKIEFNQNSLNYHINRQNGQSSRIN